MSILNSKFDILRGWPNGSAVAEDFLSAPVSPVDADHDLHNTGNWVRLNPAAGAGYTALNEDRSAKTAAVIGDSTVIPKVAEVWGLIIEGRDEYSAEQAGRVTVLMGGGYIVRLWNDPDKVLVNQMFTHTDMAPGRAVTLAAGKIVDAGLAAGADHADDTTHLFGHVLKLVGTGNDATVDIYVG